MSSSLMLAELIEFTERAEWRVWQGDPGRQAAANRRARQWRAEERARRHAKAARDMAEGLAKLGIISFSEARATALLPEPAPLPLVHEADPPAPLECQWITEQVRRYSLTPPPMCGAPCCNPGCSWCPKHAKVVFGRPLVGRSVLGNTPP